MKRIVNGEALAPVWAWRHGVYLISTDSFAAAETGLGYFTVARVEFLPDVSIKLTTVDMAHSLTDAVIMADVDAEGRQTRV